MIFQDPLSSFNPRRKVYDIVGEGLVIQGVGKKERLERVDAALQDVGMSKAMVEGRRPHQFSGGQCQRLAIARALALEPELIVCDEPVASLDVSVQAHVINLLQEIRSRRHLALVFISPRPRGGPERQRPGRGDVPGQDRGDRGGDAGLRPSCPSVHADPA